MSDFKAKMHQNPKFGWGCAPDPLGSLQRSRRPLAGFKGATSKERGGEGEEWRGGMEGGGVLWSPKNPQK